MHNGMITSDDSTRVISHPIKSAITSHLENRHVIYPDKRTPKR